MSVDALKTPSTATEGGLSPAVKVELAVAAHPSIAPAPHARARFTVPKVVLAGEAQTSCTAVQASGMPVKPALHTQVVVPGANAAFAAHIGAHCEALVAPTGASSPVGHVPHSEKVPKMSHSAMCIYASPLAWVNTIA